MLFEALRMIPNKHKMQGFENSKFTFVLSKDIPGYFYEFNADIFSSQAGTAKMMDKLIFPDLDLLPLRLASALVALLPLLYGLISDE